MRKGVGVAQVWQGGLGSRSERADESRSTLSPGGPLGFQVWAGRPPTFATSTIARRGRGSRHPYSCQSSCRKRMQG